MAVVKAGELKYLGAPIHMAGQADGKVWMMTVPASEFDQVKDKLNIIHHMQDGDQIRIRCLANEAPSADAKSVKANLEDAYLSLLNTKIKNAAMNSFSKIRLIKDSLVYNLKIIFGSKFVYFLFAALVFYFAIIGIMLFNGSAIQEYDIYGVMFFPGILIIFYPVIFSIQNDKDARMLEIVFGVPNYRYKVYLCGF